MAFPIKMKLTHKETGLSFKQWTIKTGKSNAGKHFSSYTSKYQLRPVIDMNGQPLFVNYEDFYMSAGELSPKDWKLEVALNKDENNNWIYQQVGW